MTPPGGLWMDSQPLWLLFLVSTGFIWVTWQLGYRLAARRRSATGEVEELFSSEIMAAVLGLVAFLLALTFSLAADRYAERERLALDEVEAIRAAYLSANYVAEPDGTALRTLLQNYVHARRDTITASDRLAQLAYAEEAMHDSLNAVAARLARTPDMSQVHDLVLGNLQEVITVEHRRLIVGARSRTPRSVILTLFLVIAVAMFTVGWTAGESSRHRFVTTASFAICFGIVMALISWLDRPKNSLVEENRELIVDLASWMAERPLPGTVAVPRDTTAR